MYDPNLLTSGAAARQLGISNAQFRKLGVKPVKTYINVYKQCCGLYSPEQIDSLRSDPRVEEAKQRSARAKEAKERRQKERQAKFEGLYPDWHDAVPDACDALFNLNRYAKYLRCSPGHKEEIYRLKNRLIQLLFEEGYCQECKEHLVQRPDLECWGCWGEGCERCDYTGLYRSGPLVYIAFRFKVGDRFYAWHQPKDSVNWEISLTETPSDWEPEAGIKPLSLHQKDFAEAKALIKYILKRRQAK